MKLLLDTVTFLWLAEGDPKLSDRALRLIVDPANEVAFRA
ncbi:MAG: DNA-binding protein [Spirochaetaceae bacterium]|nr:DNA-binding protein [Spirochaetaceae bacterium]